MSEVQKKLQELSEGYQKLQGGKWGHDCLKIFANFSPELSTAVEARQKLESQQQENATVQKVGYVLHSCA